ncbi:MAG: hypothetical protein AB1420_08885 [Bacillota bacterium]
MSFVLLAVVMILIVLAVREKVKSKRIKIASIGGLPEEVKISPVSQALTELVAIAGGIYLSLLMLTTFLGLELPERLSLAGIELDTVAAIALLITLLQPFMHRILNKFKRGD